MAPHSIIDESVLNDIPDELIRPLLALSILETKTFTIGQHQQLINAIDALISPYRSLEGDALYYIDLQNRLHQRMRAMRDAQEWAQQTDPQATATSTHVNRWNVHIRFSDGRSQEVWVSYVSTGLDRATMEEGMRPIITEPLSGEY